MTSKRAVFVTGAGGIVGRHFVESLFRGGHAVFATARALPSPYLDQDHFVCADLSEERSVDVMESLLSKWDGDITLVHLAAAIPHSSTYADEDACGYTTQRIDANLRQLQDRLSCRMIYMSSCGLYDREDPVPKVAGIAKCVGASPYFDAKLQGEALILSGGDSTVLRLSAPIGEGVPASLAIRKMARSVQATGLVQVWGRGTREQDFIDVRDVSALLMRAALGPFRPGTFNLAAGVATTMTDLAEALISAMGRGEIVVGGDDPNEGMTARYDITATRDSFEWRPIISLKSSCAFWWKALVSI